MSRLPLTAVPVATVVAVLAGAGLPRLGAVVVGTLAGVLVAAALWRIQRRRLHRLAVALDGWVDGGGRTPPDVPHGAGWDDLRAALVAVAASLEEHATQAAHVAGLRGDLVDAVPDPVLLFSPDGRVKTANEAARTLFGIDAEAAPTVTQALGSPHLTAVVREAAEVGRAVEVETRWRGRDVAARAAPVADDVMLVVTDRSERRQVDAVRRDFVANASHELKTPVAGIRSLAEGLAVTVRGDPSRARQLAVRLEAEAERLGRLVHDLLDLRRLEEGGSLSPAPVDLARLVRDEAERVAARAEQRGVHLSVDVPDRAVVAGAEDDLRLVVANLLDNAVTYNRPEGRVGARLRRLDGHWALEVSDSGLGIPRDELDRVFERFYRVDTARSRAAGGTGLGLAIVRHAVERHGGHVRVDSVLGEGSTFTVTVPIEPPL